MEEHMHKHKGIHLLLMGIILILVRVYTTWDIWVVIGALLIIKSLVIMLHPACKETKEKKNKK